MGQGLYDLLGFGVLHAPPLDDEVAGHAPLLEEIYWKDYLATAYETEPNYLVIRLAVDDGWLQDHWHLPALPDWVPRVAPRRGRVVTPPGDYTVPEAVRAQWRHLQQRYAEAGFTLGDGQLLLVNDWD